MCFWNLEILCETSKTLGPAPSQLFLSSLVTLTDKAKCTKCSVCVCVCVFVHLPRGTVNRTLRPSCRTYPHGRFSSRRSASRNPSPTLRAPFGSFPVPIAGQNYHRRYRRIPAEIGRTRTWVFRRGLVEVVAAARCCWPVSTDRYHCPHCRPASTSCCSKCSVVM